jgi:hypothetical protein
MEEEGVWCATHQRYHQPREHRVPCARCTVLTFEPDAVCIACQAKAVMAR